MDFYSITQWIYPVLDLIIMILCFTMLRGRGGIMLGTAFLIMSVFSFSWPISDLLANLYPGDQAEYYYEISTYVGFFTYLISSILIILGVINISIQLRTNPVSGQVSLQTNNANPYQAPTANIDTSYASYPHNFGNIIFYLIPYTLGLGTISIGLYILFTTYPSDTSLVFILTGLVLILGGSIYLFVIVYRLWAFIINESNRSGLVPSIRTPGQAVGFLFIPLFNFYWVFLVYGKMAVNINAIARQRGATNLMPEGLGVTIPILIVLTIIPYLGFVISLILGLLIVPIFISQAIRMSVSLSQSNQVEST